MCAKILWKKALILLPPMMDSSLSLEGIMVFSIMPSVQRLEKRSPLYQANKHMQFVKFGRRDN
jgi:hypothetical protein